jgi:hypothetical protein
MNRRTDSGVALIAAILMTALMSALIVGAIALTVSEQKNRFQDRDRTQAFEASHAGLEKLTNDLGDLFTKTYAPTAAQLTALQAQVPTLPDVTFTKPGQAVGSGYTITKGVQDTRTLTMGAYSGLTALVTPYTVDVTAKTKSQSEVSLQRTVNTVSIPVFQFGIFSDTDLSFFPGPQFNFGGRVHTNGNLFLAKGDGSELILGDRVTAVKEVVRQRLSNGMSISNGYMGTVRIITVDGGCGSQTAPTPTAATCRSMDRTEGSVIDTVPVNSPSDLNSNWPTISTGQTPTWYNHKIINGTTLATKLNLPLAGDGAKPIDLIARPPAGEDTTGPIFSQRFFQYASVRILLADAAVDITKLPTVTSTAPVNLSTLANNAYGPGIAKTGAVVTVPGFLKIEKQNAAGGGWSDITSTVLNMGYVSASIKTSTCTVPASGLGAMIRFQRAKRSLATCSGSLTNGTDYGPLVLYDTREGAIRDNPYTNTSLFYEGVMQYFELDITNLRAWLAAQSDIMKTTGYVVYFSDRRGSHDKDGNETGELNFEDVVNPGVMTGAPNGVGAPPPALPPAPEAGEDVNGNGKLDVSGYWTKTLAASPTLRSTALVTDAEYSATPFFRHALKLVNAKRQGMSVGAPLGLTIASENPVYIQGDYNADNNDTGSATAPWHQTYDKVHVATAVIADAVTLLSNAWNDRVSLDYPNDITQRIASQTVYRVAIIAGKSNSFQLPVWAGCVNDTNFNPDKKECPEKDFGTDGGTHNFLRFLERWTDTNNIQVPIYYRGSMVSFFYSVQATGTFKCCNTVYGAPKRQFTFDSEFLDPDLLPPRTPMVRDINTTGFNKLPGPTSP